ncbi:MAG: sigma-70 family RNA polymerase sigma factor [Frankia sp.]|nr:sigma-70 family RNA polymerase sigma factor [Frankia sp.]
MTAATEQDQQRAPAHPGGRAPTHARDPDHRRLGELLVHQHGPALARYVGRLLPGDPGRAEDIVQEIFLRAWRHADLVAVLAAQGTLEPWLYRVARNLAVDWLRRRAARPVELFEAPPAVPDPRPDDLLEAVLSRRVLTEALGSLSAPHRETVVRLHYLDRSCTDAAAELGVPPGTVKSRNHVAVRELRAALAARGVTGR